MSIYIENPKVDEIYSQVKKIITEVLKISEEKISMESSFIEDFGADSMERITLIVQLENEFEQEISAEDAEKLTTVKATVDYIVNHIEP